MNGEIAAGHQKEKRQIVRGRHRCQANQDFDNVPDVYLQYTWYGAIILSVKAHPVLEDKCLVDDLGMKSYLVTSQTFAVDLYIIADSLESLDWTKQVNFCQTELLPKKFSK